MLNQFKKITIELALEKRGRYRRAELYSLLQELHIDYAEPNTKLIVRVNGEKILNSDIRFKMLDVDDIVELSYLNDTR
jgi:hypothetical protein